MIRRHRREGGREKKGKEMGRDTREERGGGGELCVSLGNK